MILSRKETNTGTGKKYALHGTIRSAKSGETIIGATISIVNTSTATTTNEYGFYSLTLPEGQYTVQLSAVGLETKQVAVDLTKDSQLSLNLEEESKELATVTVTASATATSRKSPQMSMERINVRSVRNIPVIFGERDVLKTMQLLPGVKSAGEGNSGFYVRGGTADQNLILLDEAPVYNPSHLLGFFSTFNSDAIKNVTLYKGAQPAQYGGRLSSVVDIKMNEGNNQDLDVSGGIGLIASRLMVEGPLQKGKSSFLVSGRRTYADLFLRWLGDSSLRNARLYFYDLNTKLNFQLGKNDQLFLSGYFGRDVLSQQDIAGINWGNTTSTLRWNHIFNEKLFSNTSLIYSNYDYKITTNTEATDYHIRSRIRDWNLKEEAQWYANTRNTLTFGLNAIYHTIKPGEISVGNENEMVSEDLQDRYSLESALYASNTWRASDKWSLTYGLRLSAFTILGEGDYYHIDADGNVTDTLHYNRGEVVKTYIDPEPRIAASYQLNSSSALKLSYSRNVQNLHLVSNSTSASPTDKWVASTNIIKPEKADQLALGYYKSLNDPRYELNVEAYYKTMQNVIDYRNGAQVFTNEPIETQLLFGKGRAYGMEWLFKKKAGRFSGWVSYTLSKTERQIEGINNGQWYNARQDRTHDIAIVGMYQLNNKWTLSANWIYYTGDAVTYPTGKYRLDNEVYFYFSDRNGYRMPNYHRLDLGATRQLKKGKKFSSELNFSLFNAYGHANAYQISFRESETDPSKTEAVQTSLFTFVPSITYNFKF
ncbi:collagen-binding protein [Flavisolibacter tropicus]|uniref:Collagen-binding protein n=1 Tax=Flavisolibacter tropicus TaxID=1492898 RepID=A0A172U3H1_9BACT|nr:collagen-binding protein [Flavisolibacter tropicus]